MLYDDTVVRPLLNCLIDSYNIFIPTHNKFILYLKTLFDIKSSAYWRSSELFNNNKKKLLKIVCAKVTSVLLRRETKRKSDILSESVL